MKCEACDHDNVDGARFCANCGAVLPVEAEKGAGLVGQTVGGRFRILRVLGEGGMGIVYEGEQPMGSAVRKVAVKTLHAHLSHDPSVSARFHRECGTVAQLEHPNTIKVYDFGTTSDGTLYIAMEFVDGTSLMDEIRAKGRIEPQRALRLLKQIGGALTEAHKQGIIHRDLKPENIVLTQRAGEKDVVKLLDFGIAARTESADAEKEQKLTQQGMVLGTPPYMSPEQFTGKALDPRSDIYSLGVVAYEMLTGRLPFDADTPWQWATEHMMSQPMPFDAAVPTGSGIPEQMRVAILRALAKDREDRQSDVSQFLRELTDEVPVPVAAADAARASTGTAAMEAAPDFGGGPALGSARTAAMPAPSATPGPMAASAAIPAAPSGVAQGGGGGNKGLVMALGGAAAVLLIGIVVVAMGGNKDGDEDAPPPPLDDEPKAAASIAPVMGGDEADEPPAPATEPDPSPSPSPSPVAKASPKPSPGPGPAAAPAPAPAPAPTPAPEPAPAPKPRAAPKPAPAPKPKGDPCAACESAARGGSFASAASAYGSCTDAAKKRICSGIVKQKAPTAAQNAAFNGNCGAAKAIVAAANAMGAGSSRLNSAASSCK